ncbi:efflux RND transporter periplasmic adaptor subunit [Roseospira goensis]|uniref:RND family efflux transporter MFP subunit n=1 Tax=Roseospira goensis TaxID=391922 RepID=A0A7W6RZ37_9PROT|nr:efflux RND transporter periplasmic adaptor subunit [Roseospira goensis]MBB4285249.1 RND family efflux transporter MFP subunit [Roseospira goensis]
MPLMRPPAPALSPPVLAGLIGLVCLMVATAALAQPLTVHPRRIADHKAVFATVESVDVLAARARLGGTVESLRVDEGDAVSDGQIVAVVVDEKLAPRMEALESQLNAQRASVEQARTDFDRARRLRADGVAPQSRLDAASTALEVAERQLDSLQSDLEVLRQQEAEGDVRAPGPGRVLEVSVSEGSVVMPGEPLVRVATETYLLRLRLPERHARFIAVGETVRVGPRGLDPDESDPADPAWRDGTIVKVYPELENGRVIADVEVAGLGGYFVGERALVEIVTGARTAFVVPPAYVRSRHGVTVAHLDSGAVVVVQLGAAVPGGVEVLSGLRPGDTLLPLTDVSADAADASGGSGE